jgi:hypothetical protein
MLSFRAEEWAVWVYVQPPELARDMSSGPGGRRGTCPVFGLKNGQFGHLSSRQANRGACPGPVAGGKSSRRQAGPDLKGPARRG